MKFALFATLAASASAFAPTFGVARSNMALNADLIETMKSAQGPHICWGSEGVMLGYEENDVKGYDNLGNLVEAIEKAGLTETLKGPGPFTIIAPVDSIIAQTGKEKFTADVLKYHVVEGKHTVASIGGDLKTLNGKDLTYARKFRKTFLDDTIMGQETNYGGGSGYPCDIEADNGIIHIVSTTLDPSFVTLNAEAGLGGVV
ncbi:hypothetical protein TrCOL_g12542 [Triparma columacea]|uniref:FAS1 domain-containing protein n=1 Tax=Triparma columacea TaxID=722753 RepID=A0A9W7G3P2_9STRA|nr:hypothetical protein TrCOL_g12542 [Triparma columacea]